MHDLFAAQTYHLGYQVHPSGWRLSDESDMSLVIKQKKKKTMTPKRETKKRGEPPACAATCLHSCPSRPVPGNTRVLSGLGRRDRRVREQRSLSLKHRDMPALEPTLTGPAVISASDRVSLSITPHQVRARDGTDQVSSCQDEAIVIRYSSYVY